MRKFVLALAVALVVMISIPGVGSSSTRTETRRYFGSSRDWVIDGLCSRPAEEPSVDGSVCFRLDSDDKQVGITVNDVVASAVPVYYSFSNPYDWTAGHSGTFCTSAALQIPTGVTILHVSVKGGDLPVLGGQCGDYRWPLAGEVVATINS